MGPKVFTPAVDFPPISLDDTAMPESALQRAAEFELPDALRVATGEGGLGCLEIDTAACRARQYLHGATVTHWQPAGHDPVLFTSKHAVFCDGKAIRGGVPICFPWFGAHPTDTDAPSHGLVRTQPWHVTQTALGPDGVDVDLVCHLDQLSADFRVTFGQNLTLSLTVTNSSDTDQDFEAALHTYLAVGDVRNIEITGLENAAYIDQLQDNQRLNQGDTPITFAGETDNIYQDTEATCVLHDPGKGRRIVVDKLGSKSTVVWNPWTDKAGRLADFGDDEWPGMCCIETANIDDHAVQLAPGAAHTMRVTIGVESAK